MTYPAIEKKFLNIFFVLFLAKLKTRLYRNTRSRHETIDALFNNIHRQKRIIYCTLKINIEIVYKKNQIYDSNYIKHKNTRLSIKEIIPLITHWTLLTNYTNYTYSFSLLINLILWKYIHLVKKKNYIIIIIIYFY